MEIDLVLFRPSRRSNIYLVDHFTGIVYGIVRSKKQQWTLLSCGKYLLERGELVPMRQYKKLREVRDHYNRVFGLGG